MLTIERILSRLRSWNPLPLTAIHKVTDNDCCWHYAGAGEAVLCKMTYTAMEQLQSYCLHVRLGVLKYLTKSTDMLPISALSVSKVLELVVHSDRQSDMMSQKRNRNSIIILSNPCRNLPSRSSPGSGPASWETLASP